MRTLGAIIFLFCLPGRADSVEEVLKKLHHEPSVAFHQAEDLYRSTKDSDKAARLATILSFAPESELKGKPHHYAHFAFIHDKSAPKEIHLKLAKLAGEGFFTHGEFRKAKLIFSKVLREDDLSLDDQEYFTYQLAWCEINLNQYERAVSRFFDWFEKCPSCRLHREMVIDFGKSYAGLKRRETKWFKALANDEDVKSFVDGFASEVLRNSSAKSLQMGSVLDGQSTTKEWLRLIFSDSRFKDFGPCRRLAALENTDSELWPKEEVRSDLLQCSLSGLKKKSFPWNQILEIYLQIPGLSANDLFMIAEIQERLSQLEQSCKSRIRAFGTEADEALPKGSATIPALVDICRPYSSKFGKELASILSLKNFRHSLETSEDKKDLMGIYLKAFAGSPQWKKEFESKKISDWLTFASADLIKQILESSAWTLSFRMRLWDLASEETAFAPSVRISLAKAAYEEGIQQYHEFQKKLERRKAPVDGVQLLLSARDKIASIDQRFYKASLELPSGQWKKLSADEQAEVIQTLLKQGYLQAIVSDWNAWSERMKGNSSALSALLTQALTERKSEKISFDSFPDYMEELLALGSDDLSGPVKLDGVPQSLLSDVQIINSSLRSREKVVRAEKSQSIESLIMSVDSVQKLVDRSAKYKWKVEGLKELNRTLLKKNLALLSSALLKRSNDPDLKELAILVNQWEKEL